MAVFFIVGDQAWKTRETVKLPLAEIEKLRKKSLEVDEDTPVSSRKPAEQ